MPRSIEQNLTYCITEAVKLGADVCGVCHNLIPLSFKLIAKETSWNNVINGYTGDQNIDTFIDFYNATDHQEVTRAVKLENNPDNHADHPLYLLSKCIYFGKGIHSKTSLRTRKKRFGMILRAYVENLKRLKCPSEVNAALNDFAGKAKRNLFGV